MGGILTGRIRNLALLHFVVVIFGFTAIIRRFTGMDSLDVVWYRMGIAFVGLLIFMIVKGYRFEDSWKARGKFLLVGAVVAAHWLFFFEGIEIANASACLAGLASTSLFVALAEPLIFKRKLRVVELLLGAIVIIGLLFIGNELPKTHLLGLVFGVIAAVLAALFGTINGKFIEKHDANVITLWEMLGGTIAATIYLAVKGELNQELFQVSGESWFWLLLLGLVCTSFAYVASVQVMKELTPFTVSLAINMEPVYTMVIAVLIFDDEKMSPGFYIGGLIILATIIGNAFYKRWLNRRAAAG